MITVPYVILQYGLAEDTLRSGRQVNGKDVSPNELYSQSAIYVAAAHALKPNYSVAYFLFYLFLGKIICFFIPGHILCC